MECTNPEFGRLITRYELGALNPVEHEVFVDHILHCLHCHDQVYSMAPFAQMLRAHREKSTRASQLNGRAARHRLVPIKESHSVWSSKRFLVAASVLLTMGITSLAWYWARSGDLFQSTKGNPSLALFDPSGSRGDHVDLLNPYIPKATFTAERAGPLVRSTGAESAFGHTMSAYLRNDFSTAAKELEIVTRIAPDHAEAHFYLGVSLLLQGKTRDALAPLRKASQLHAGVKRQRSHYYLALGYLRAGKLQKAAEEFHTVTEIDGPYQEGAQRYHQTLSQKLKE